MRLLKVGILIISGTLFAAEQRMLIPPMYSESPADVNPFLAEEPLGYDRMIITADEEWLHNRINQLRAEKGAGPLHWNNQLTAAAKFHSWEMIENDYFEHESVDKNGKVYETTYERLARFDYTYYPLGENIACYPTAPQAYNGWFNSPGHYSNMIEKAFTESGLGQAVGGPCGNMYTHDFGFRPISFDLEISSDDINWEQIDGNTLQITAIIHNPGKTHAYPVMVRFYDGNPSSVGKQIGADVKVPAIIIGDDYRPDTAKLEWDFCLKAMSDDTIETDIYVVVDPEDKFDETNEGNNIAHINTKYIAKGEDVVLYPQRLAIQSTYPNPVKSSAIISYSVPNRMPVSLSVFDASGRKVKDLFSGKQTAGNHDIQWNGLDASGNEVAAGVYILCLVGADQAHTKSLVVVR
ncbi:T9SS type A sorting domain-containing protein [candidate division WOR-3 bacterium]|nr:T9SS type A sorting domain-containing protein [candidate division WOR-3 bacterium]